MYFSKYLLYDIISYAEKRGADKQELNKILQLEYDDNQSQYVSYEKTIQTLHFIRQTIDEELLGLKMGEQLMLKSTEQVDGIMEHSPTLEEAFKNACDYSKLISDALESKIEMADDQIMVQFEVNPNWAVGEDNAVQQIIDLTLICTSKSIFRLTGAQRFPIVVHFNYPRPKKINEYFRLFNCALQFNQPVPTIIFERQIFNQSLSPQSEGLLNILKIKAQEEINQLGAEPLLINQIKQLLLSNRPERLSLETVSKELKIPSRTLQRNLKQLNTNFKKIDDEIMMGLAKKFLKSSDRKVEEISYLLGFSESSAFVRYFKNKMNITPKKYRNTIG